MLSSVRRWLGDIPSPSNDSLSHFESENCRIAVCGLRKYVVVFTSRVVGYFGFSKPHQSNDLSLISEYRVTNLGFDDSLPIEGVECSWDSKHLAVWTSASCCVLSLSSVEDARSGRFQRRKADELNLARCRRLNIPDQSDFVVLECKWHPLEMGTLFVLGTDYFLRIFKVDVDSNPVLSVMLTNFASSPRALGLNTFFCPVSMEIFTDFSSLPAVETGQTRTDVYWLSPSSHVHSVSFADESLRETCRQSPIPVVSSSEQGTDWESARMLALHHEAVPVVVVAGRGGQLAHYVVVEGEDEDESSIEQSGRRYLHFRGQLELSDESDGELKADVAKRVLLMPDPSVSWRYVVALDSTVYAVSLDWLRTLRSSISVPETPSSSSTGVRVAKLAELSDPVSSWAWIPDRRGNGSLACCLTNGDVVEVGVSLDLMPQIRSTSHRERAKSGSPFDSPGSTFLSTVERILKADRAVPPVFSAGQEDSDLVQKFHEMIAYLRATYVERIVVADETCSKHCEVLAKLHADQLARLRLVDEDWRTASRRRVELSAKLDDAAKRQETIGKRLSFVLESARDGASLEALSDAEVAGVERLGDTLRNLSVMRVKLNRLRSLHLAAAAARADDARTSTPDRQILNDIENALSLQNEELSKLRVRLETVSLLV